MVLCLFSKFSLDLCDLRSDLSIIFYLTSIDLLSSSSLPAGAASLCAFAGITIYDNEASFTGQPSGTDGVLIGVTGLEVLICA